MVGLGLNLGVRVRVGLGLGKLMKLNNFAKISGFNARNELDKVVIVVKSNHFGVWGRSNA